MLSYLSKLYPKALEIYADLLRGALLRLFVHPKGSCCTASCPSVARYVFTQLDKLLFVEFNLVNRSRFS